MDEDQPMHQQEFEVELMNHHQEPEEDVFFFGDPNKDFISSSDLNHLLLSEDAKDKDKLNSIIIKAVTTKNYEILITLLNQGYQLDVLNDKSQTLTALAYYSDTYSSLFWSTDLVFSNCQNYKNYVDENGLSHLHIACAVGHIETVKKFLDNGEDIHGRLIFDCNTDKSGFTPLHFAVAHHVIEVVKLLLERGADINAVDSLGCTPIHLASAVSWDFEKFTELDTLRKRSCWINELCILILLLEHNCDLNLRDKNGNTPLLKTFSNNYYNSGLSSEALNTYFGKELLLSSLQKRQLEKFKILFEHGADITVKNYDNENILHCIIADLTITRFSSVPLRSTHHDKAYTEIIQLLLEANKGLDVNAKNKKGETPIALAVSLISFDLISILLQHNADLSSIRISDRNFFRYPKIVLTTDIVSSLHLIMPTLISKGFELTLEENLVVMKFFEHFDENDCDCGLVMQGPALELVAGEVVFYGSANHLKRVVMTVSEIADEALKHRIFNCIRVYVEYCKLVSYPLMLDDEILQILYDNTTIHDFSSLSQKCQENVIFMKSTALKNGWSLYDFVTKSSRFPDVLKYWDNDYEATSMDKLIKRPLNGMFILGHFTKLAVRRYVESWAQENYISLLIPSLPDLCHKNILEYLDNEDIIRLCAAAILE